MLRSRLSVVWHCALLALVVLLAGCGTSPPPQPFRLNGYWGGVMNYAGVDYFVFVVDVNTSSAGSVTGYGLFTGDPTGQTGVWVTVTGNTQPTSVNLTLRDGVNDTIQLSGNVERAVVRGSWFYASGGVTGSFRMAAEENIHLLRQPQPYFQPQKFSSLFGSGR